MDLNSTHLGRWIVSIELGDSCFRSRKRKSMFLRLNMIHRNSVMRPCQNRVFAAVFGEGDIHSVKEMGGISLGVWKQCGNASYIRIPLSFRLVAAVTPWHVSQRLHVRNTHHRSARGRHVQVLSYTTLRL
jgi:hypothetical protein